MLSSEQLMHDFLVDCLQIQRKQLCFVFLDQTKIKLFRKKPHHHYISISLFHPNFTTSFSMF